MQVSEQKAALDAESNAPVPLPAELAAARREVSTMLRRTCGDAEVLPTFEDCSGPLTLDSPFVRLSTDAFAWMRAGDGETARALFEEALMMRPLGVEANYNMATFYEVAHQPDGVLRWVERTLRIRGNHYDSWVMKGGHQERMCDTAGAMESYRIASTCPGATSLATDRLAQIMVDMKVCLSPETAWPGAAGDILAENACWSDAFPRWQENFLHEVDEPVRSPLLVDGVCAWDDVFSEPLLTLLEECAVQMHLFWETNPLANPDQHSVTAWFPWNSKEPEVAAELAALLVAPLLGERPADFCGVEWLARCRAANRGMNLHYDVSESDDACMLCTRCGKRQGDEWLHGNPWRPKWICMLFLTDEGGPCVANWQVHTNRSQRTPRCPQRSAICMPKRGRLFVFRGDLWHGNLAIDPQDTALRKILGFCLWQTHPPPPDHCVAVEFERYIGVQTLLRPRDQLEELRRAHKHVAEDRRIPSPGGDLLGESPGHLVPLERLTRAADLPWSAEYGFSLVRLPLPTSTRLRSGSGLFKIDWRAAAEDFARGVPMERRPTAPMAFERVD